MALYYPNKFKLLLFLIIATGTAGRGNCMDNINSPFINPLINTSQNTRESGTVIFNVFPLQSVQLAAIINDTEDLDPGGDSSGNAKASIESQFAFSDKYSGYAKSGTIGCGLQHIEYPVTFSDLPPPFFS